MYSLLDHATLSTPTYHSFPSGITRAHVALAKENNPSMFLSVVEWKGVGKLSDNSYN